MLYKYENVLKSLLYTSFGRIIYLKIQGPHLALFDKAFICERHGTRLANTELILYITVCKIKCKNCGDLVSYPWLHVCKEIMNISDLDDYLEDINF